MPENPLLQFLSIITPLFQVYGIQWASDFAHAFCAYMSIYFRTLAVFMS